MKRVALLIAAGLTLAGCFSRRPATPVPVLPPGPSAVTPEADFDFGSVEQGAFVTHTFRIANQGQQDLEIESVQGSCGCTAALASRRTVASGEDTAIEVTLDTHKMAGAHARAVNVRTNDPARPIVSFILHGTVTAEVVASPAEVYLGRVPHGASVSRTVEVTIGEQVTITRVSSESGRLQVKSTPLPPPERGMSVVVTLPGSVEPGRFNDQILIASTSVKQPLLSIPVLASVESDLAAWPPRLQFGWVAAGASAGEIRLRNRSKAPIEVAAVRASSPALVASVEAEQPGWKYRVRLKVRADAARSDIDGTVEVLAAGSDQPITVVPVSGRVRGTS